MACFVFIWVLISHRGHNEGQYGCTAGYGRIFCSSYSSDAWGVGYYTQRTGHRTGKLCSPHTVTSRQVRDSSTQRVT